MSTVDVGASTARNGQRGALGHLEAAVSAEKLGPGSLGVVMARAGVGKTACLVQIGLDRLFARQPVFHVALGQTVEHVHAWYDALFDDRLRATSAVEPGDAESLRAELGRFRLITAFQEPSFSAERVEKALGLFQSHMAFRPQVLLVDGFPWDEATLVRQAAELGALKALARRLGAILWMTAQTHREVTGSHPLELCPPCAAFADLIDVALFLEPRGANVDVRVLKAPEGAVAPTAPVLALAPDTLRLVSFAPASGAPAAAGLGRLPAPAYTMLSGGAPGAEAEFGACAERWGLREVTYTFAGRATERSRGVTTLSEADLKLGDVSSAYLRQQMHRTYPDTPTFRQVLQLVWHEVSSAGEVFVVGVIQPDRTVRGGTGWAAELAKHWKKPVFVYDQERKGWFVWQDGDWATCTTPPVISRPRFCGTGTRFLSEDGRQAVRSLFERSFGHATRA